MAKSEAESERGMMMTPSRSSLEAWALKVVQTLRRHGHQAYWAGGCVRDRLRGEEPHDFDVATDAHPEQVVECFANTRAVGKKFGVVLVRQARDEVEVATFRRDGAYLDGRHPSAVTYGTLEDDVRRRDFTINGMLYDPLADRVIDLVGGRRDLEAGILRAIGDPAQRFAEDHLRVLRAARFAARLGYQVEPATLHAAQSTAPQICQISAERIGDELERILVHPTRRQGLELIDRFGLLPPLLPEVDAMHGIPQGKPMQPRGDLWEHTCLVLEMLQTDNFALALATLLHDAGKPATMDRKEDRLTFYHHELTGSEMARDICHRLKLSNTETSRVTWLVLHHMYLGEPYRMRLSKLKRILAHPDIDLLLELHRADALASHGNVEHVDYCRRLLTELDQDKLCPPYLLTGHDLVRYGLKPGPQFKEILEAVRDAQLEEKILSKKVALKLVDQMLAEKGQQDLRTAPDPL